MSVKDVATVVVAMNIMCEAEEQLKPLLQKHKLSMNEWLVLKVVYLGFVASPSEAATYLNMQRASVTRHAEHLCNQKLLDRLYNIEDRRTVKLTVTSTGNRLCKTILAKYPNVINKMPDRLDDKDKHFWLSIMNAKNI